MTTAPERSIVEWSAAGAALDGAADSGDLHVVADYPGGALVAVLDGLGHGREAAVAARAGARVLEERAGEPLSSLVQACHEALRPTRGAVMSLAAFDVRAASMRWLGVGNVEAFLLRRGSAGPRESIPLRGGVVGYQLPPLREDVLPVAAGDTLVMATDGLRSSFVGELSIRGTPQEMAADLLARFARGTDDALVVVARYVGAAPGAAP